MTKPKARSIKLWVACPVTKGSSETDKRKAKSKAQSTEESDTETDVQQNKRRKLPWVLQKSSFWLSC
jgi:hypothetical protein